MTSTVLLATLRDTPLLPSWVAALVAMPTLVVVAGHVLAIHRVRGGSSGMPESRRRLRLANGGLMLVAIPVIAFAFGYATPAEPKLFMSLWLVAMWLLGLIVVLAGVDAMVTARIAKRERAQLRKSIRSLREEALRAQAERSQRTDRP